MSKTPQRVEVEWEDSAWQRVLSSGELPITTVVLRTLGWLVYKDKQRVVVAGEWCESDRNYRDVTAIPLSVVRHIRRLR